MKCYIYIDVMQYITCKLIYFSINLSIPEGHLVAIVGPVGAGKSSIASTLLGETVRRQGSTVVNVGIEYQPYQNYRSSIFITISLVCAKLHGFKCFQGSIAYVPQQAWIQNKTLKDNILFSKPYRSTLYENTLSACAMVEDLKILPGGDMTEIGEKVNVV